MAASKKKQQLSVDFFNLLLDISPNWVFISETGMGGGGGGGGANWLICFLKPSYSITTAAMVHPH